MRIPLNGGITVDINEPRRTQFPDNLGGAVQYSLVYVVYKILELMGAGISKFLASFLINFLEFIEPSLVDYVSPMIDDILAVPELPTGLRKFLLEVKAARHETAAGLLMGIGSQVSSMTMNSVFSILLAPTMFALNRRFRYSKPSPIEAWTMAFRGLIDLAQVHDYLADMGYSDDLINGYQSLARPRLTPTEQLVWAWRMFKDPNAVKANLLELGYTAEDITKLIQLSQAIPSISDLITMAVREAWRDDVAARWGYDEEFPSEFADWCERQGLSKEWAKRYWRAHWDLPSVTLGFEMFHRGIISRQELETLLKVSDYPAGWREKMIQAAYTPITRVDVRRIYSLGLLDHNGLVRRYMDIGYSPEDAELLARFTEEYEARKNKPKPEKSKRVSYGVIVNAYRQGVISLDEARKRLKDIGYIDTDIDLLLADVRRKLSADDIISAYRKSLISFSTAKSHLGELGYSEEDINILLARINRELSKDDIVNAYRHKIITESEARERLRDLNFREADIRIILAELPQTLTKSDILTAYYRNVINSDQAIMMLRGIGYRDEDARLLISDGYKYLDKSDIITAYRNNVITFDQARSRLKELGYNDDSIKILLSPRTRELSVSAVQKSYFNDIIDYEQAIDKLLLLGYNITDANTLLQEEPGELHYTAIENAYRRGVISRDEAIDRLLADGFVLEDIELLLAVADARREAEELPDYVKEYRNDVKSIVEKSYASRLISDTVAKDYLVKIGYNSTDAELLLSVIDFAVAEKVRDNSVKLIGEAYVSRSIDRVKTVELLGKLDLPSSMQDQLFLEWDIQREIRTRRLTEAQYRKALQSGIITKEEYIESCQGLGYSDYDIDILLKLAKGGE